MSWTRIIWDPTADGNVEHIEQHDLTTDDVDHVLENYDAKGFSRSTGKRAPSATRLTDVSSSSSTKKWTTRPYFP